jgi:hypothetical protein
MKKITTTKTKVKLREASVQVSKKKGIFAGDISTQVGVQIQPGVVLDWGLNKTGFCELVCWGFGERTWREK